MSRETNTILMRDLTNHNEKKTRDADAFELQENMNKERLVLHNK